MAADLTPRFRRIRSMGELRPRRRGYAGPFQATQLWNSIIHALKTEVEVKNRRQHLRTYSSCFTGSDAVDVVLCHLMQNMYLSSHDISRNKGVQLCQALMDHKVFEPVASKLFKMDTDFVFEDSNSNFYRFIESKKSTNLSSEGKSIGKVRRLSRSGHASTICNPSALDTANEKLTQLLHCICDHPNVHLNPALNNLTTTVSQKDTENIWKQQVMVRLLQLIHIPVLEDILEPPIRTEHKTHFSDLIVSNTFVDREVLQTINLPKLDRWLAAAVECLEYFPDQQIVMLSQQLPQSNFANEGLDLYKKMLFDVIAKYYTQERDPFLDSWLLKLLGGIVELLERGKETPALEAVQLYLRLLVPKAREEFRRLVLFMATASDASSCKLQKQFDNKAVVTRTLTKILFQSPVISKVHSEEFTVFLLENCSELFKTPVALLDLISTKLRSVQNGEDPDTHSGFTFCQYLTLEEFEKQRYYFTTSELQLLVETISRDKTIAEKKRKKMMKDFQKHHPSAFRKHPLD
ncbi:DEP domain-containing protein 4 [Spea bombifrons]|uniref:DEP domain-containing protein 4 n=1 Tax=Spea bombifrons TaxID=233779 RepID=UPI00234AD4F9|nr:DEP domain-containing protein 4 [Spea bombifrons]